MDYIVFQLGSRQYLIKPGQVLEVDKIIDELKTFSTEKVLLLVDKDKIEIGEPFLEKTVDLEILGNVKKEKVRVATYKAKANYRRVSGQTRELTKVRLKEDEAVKK